MLDLALFDQSCRGHNLKCHPLKAKVEVGLFSEFQYIYHGFCDSDCFSFGDRDVNTK